MTSRKHRQERKEGKGRERKEGGEGEGEGGREREKKRENRSTAGGQGYVKVAAATIVIPVAILETRTLIRILMRCTEGRRAVRVPPNLHQFVVDIPTRFGMFCFDIVQREYHSPNEYHRHENHHRSHTDVNFKISHDHFEAHRGQDDGKRLLEIFEHGLQRSEDEKERP